MRLDDVGGEAPEAPNEYDAEIAAEVVERNEYDAALQGEQDDETVRSLLGEAFQTVGDRGAAEARLVEKTGMAPTFVKAHFDALNASWEAAGRDPRKWREANPEKAKAIRERPHLGKTIVADEYVTKLTTAARGLGAFVGGMAQKVLDPTDTSNSGGAAVAAMVPRQIEILDDARAAEVAQKGIAGRAFATYEDTAAGLELQTLYADSADAFLLGRDRYEIEAKIADIEAKAGRRQYAQSEGEQYLHDFAEMTASNIETGKASAGAGAAGALVGAAVTRTVPGAVGGFFAGARVGAAAKSYRLEYGSSYGELQKIPGIDDELAVGAAMISGALKAGIETASFGSSEKAAGPALQALKTGSGLGAALRDAAFVKLARAAGRHAMASAATEGLIEEPSQSLVDSVAEWGAKSKQAGELQDFDAPEALTKALEAGAKAMVGGAGSAVVTTVASAGANRAAAAVFSDADLSGLDREVAAAQRAQAASERGASIVAMAKELAAGPTAQASPEAAAAILADATAKTGKEVTHLYVDAEALRRYFQDGKENPEDLLGPGGEKRISEAIASGDKVEVPVAEYLERWAPHASADALVEHTTTEAGLDTAAQAKAKAEAETSRKPSEAEARLRRTMEEQLQAAGLKSGEARDSAAPYIAALRTLGERSGRGADALFEQYQITIEKGRGETAGKTQEARLAADVLLEARLAEQEKLPAEERTALRIAEVGLDSVSGLRNRRAFDAAGVAPGKRVLAITTTDAKPINDHPTAGGHDVTNDLFRAMGAALADRPDAARGGTTFFVQVGDDADAAAVLARVKAAAPGVAIQSAIGADAAAAGTALDTTIDDARTAKT
ncbi:MAG: hypothetical protein NUW21_16135, partial [Elusimicrobia bacterium]|nr:hypothetical protein [Elusimicrobiota bacterium]